MVSRLAARVYGTAAGACLLLLVLIVFPLQDGAFLDELLGPVGPLLVYAGILGAGTIEVGMAYFWFFLDLSSEWKKALWFVALCVFPFGPLLYYWFVYRREVARLLAQTDAQVMSAQG